PHLTGGTHTRVKAARPQVSLGALSTVSNSPAIKDLKLAGTANANLNAAWGKTTDNLLASVVANTQGSFQPAGSGGRVPLSGHIQAQYKAVTKQLALAPSFVRTPQTMVSLNGILSTTSALNVRFTSNDLHEVEGFLPASTTKGLNVYGPGAFDGNVHGSTDQPPLQELVCGCY